MNDKPLVLLTGGRGMVGSNILEHPMAHLFRFLSPTSEELNLCDFPAVQKYFSMKSPQFVIHAAGLVGGIQANLASPVKFLVENIDMGRNVLLASHNAGIKKIINLSSSCMYPRNAKNPLTEDLILTGGLEPTNEGYALAKILTLRLGEYINKENDQFNCKTLIPCNLYGRFDKFDPDRSHLIPAIIHKIHQAKINHSGTVEIWGDGSARREFMYAGDLADAVIRSLITFDEVPSIMNLGLGYDFTINEYYESVASVVGWHGRFIHDLSRPVGMQQKLVSTALQEKWGWTPSTSIRDGIQKTYDFYLKNLQ